MTDPAPAGPWPWFASKKAHEQYADLTVHWSAPLPQDAMDAMIRAIAADPYGTGSTSADHGPDWDRVAASGSLIVPYQVHDPDRNPRVTRRAVVFLRFVWAD